jgi:hypothetical protein
VEQGEAAVEAVHQASLGRLRGRVTDILSTETTKPKPDPPAPNFLFYPATKAMPGGARSVPAEPMIKLLRLLHSITNNLDAVAKKDKVMHALCCEAIAPPAHAVLQMMQSEIQQQGAELASLKARHQLKQPQQPVVHTSLSMQSASFPVASASELTAHPGDVLQVTHLALPAASALD